MKKISYATGKRIYLRPIEKKDINKKYLAWINNQKLCGHLEVNRFPNSIKDLKDYYKNSKSSKRKS